MLAPLADSDLARQAAQTLLAHLGPPAVRARPLNRKQDSVGFVVHMGALCLAIEVKRSSEPTALRAAVDSLKSYREQNPSTVCLVATQYMSPAGRQVCADHGLGWFDLSGNADISAPGLRILIDGKPNQFKRAGRPSTAFAPKSARITRWFLMYGDVGGTQQQITEQTQLDKGYASRVLKRLRGEALIRMKGDKYVADDRSLLLKAWQARYDFSKHRILRGVLPARSGEEAVRKIASELTHDAYAATGLAAAWFLDHFAEFRTASVYLREEPSEAFLERISFQRVERGANVWLIVPNDEGVFQGRGEADGIVCVHWVQAYLDLGFHPERAKEAAEHLREMQQNWSQRGP